MPTGTIYLGNIFLYVAPVKIELNFFFCNNNNNKTTTNKDEKEEE